ncbi:uncharacterized protein [Scyliorhinus torazame]
MEKKGKTGTKSRGQTANKDNGIMNCAHVFYVLCRTVLPRFWACLLAHYDGREWREGNEGGVRSVIFWPKDPECSFENKRGEKDSYEVNQIFRISSTIATPHVPIIDCKDVVSQICRRTRRQKCKDCLNSDHIDSLKKELFCYWKKFEINYEMDDKSLKSMIDTTLHSYDSFLNCNHGSITRNTGFTSALAAHSLQLCFLLAARSDDPDRGVGAIIYNKRHSIIGAGYNGYITKTTYGNFPRNGRNSNRTVAKFSSMVHAEVNALLLSFDCCGLQTEKIRPVSLYFHFKELFQKKNIDYSYLLWSFSFWKGLNLLDPITACSRAEYDLSEHSSFLRSDTGIDSSVMFSSKKPCSECEKVINACGIKIVVSVPDPKDAKKPRALESGETAQESGVGAQQSGQGAEESGVGAQQSGEGAQESGVGAQQSGEGAQQSGEGAQESGMEVGESGVGAQQSGEGAQESGVGAQKLGEGAQESGEGAQESGEGAQESGMEVGELGDGAQESGEGAQQLGEGAQESGEGAQQSGEGAQESGEGAQESGERAQESGMEVRELGDGAQESGEGAQQLGEGAQESGEGAQESGEGAQESGERAPESGEGSQESGEGSQESGMEVAELGDGAQEAGKGVKIILWEWPSELRGNQDNTDSTTMTHPSGLAGK